MIAQSVLHKLRLPKHAGSILVALAVLVTAPAHSARAVTARWSYETAYPNVNGGDWYRDANNETATLAWGESYVMASLAAMFRATGDPVYLERLAWHLDGVLAQRDDVRGVADYRSVSGACWRNTHYQPNDEPYCYVVHSGMIAWSLAEFARLVNASGLEQERAWDNETFGNKAAAYVVAAHETVAYHSDQWDNAGYYFFRTDATFLTYAGSDLPLNQSNAMGRLLLALHDVTAEPDYLAKATALAQRFKAQLTTGGSGEYLWNYWGGAYASPGEDISHAAINVDFAVMAAERGIVFNSSDLEAFALTFVANVYIDDETFANGVGGGATNTYRAQAGRWLRLTPVRTAIYTAVRDLYDRFYQPAGVGSGSVLTSWGLLAEFEPLCCPHFFYSVDWFDPDPNSDDDWREATAYGANILTTPPDLTQGCMIPLEVSVPRQTQVQQWDGNAYHTVSVWRPTGGQSFRFVPYEPRWPFIYWNGGVLYQFADTFVAGNGIQVKENPGLTPPQITSTPPTEGPLGQPVGYTASGTGDPPFWWSLPVFPTGARIDPATGALSYTPPTVGNYTFTVRLANNVGVDEQSFVYTAVEQDAGVGDGQVPLTDGSLTDGNITDGPTGDGAVVHPDGGDGDSHRGGCNCRHTAVPKADHTGILLLVLFLLGLAFRRRRTTLTGRKARAFRRPCGPGNPDR